MYDMYVKKYDKEYIAIEDDEALSIINSNSDIEEILELENDIEKVINKINDYKKEINDLELEIHYKESLNYIFYFFEIIICLGFSFTFPLYIAILLFLTSVVSHNIYLTKNFEPKVSINKKIKNINREIEKQEKTKEEYNNKLKYMKLLSNYKKTNIENNLEKIGIMNDIAINYQSKIKRLVKTKGVNNYER